MKKYKAGIREKDKPRWRDITFHAKDFDHATNIAQLALCDNERVFSIQETREQNT